MAKVALGHPGWWKCTGSRRHFDPSVCQSLPLNYHQLPQAAVIAHVHSKNVIHCDIQPQNLLLDENLHLKLSDFQGNYLSDDGQIVLEGGSAEPCRFFCPRDDLFDTDIKTDLFALGCTIYFIMIGNCVFPDILDGEDGWYEKVRNRFASRQFPQEPHFCNNITLNCWEKRYGSVFEVLCDIEAAEEDRNGRER